MIGGKDSMSARHWRGLIVITLCGMAVSFLLQSCGRSTPVVVEQPIKYSHELHVTQEGLECLDCHVHAKDQPRATIPNIEICSDCHEPGDPLGDSPEEAKLLKYLAAGKKVPWRKIYRVPSHVYFSHRRHTTLAQLECSVCHGKMEEQAVPIRMPIVPVRMKACLRCHEKNSVDTDCVRCHR